MARTATTLLRMVNMILVRLRETTVTTISGSGITAHASLAGTGKTPSYTDTIVRLINDSKIEVEDSYDWIELRQMISVLVESGEITNNIYDDASTARQQGDKRGSDNQEHTGPRSRVLSVWNYTTNSYLRGRSYDWMLKQHNDAFVSGATGEPMFWTVGPPGNMTNDALDLKTYPVSDGSYELEVQLYNPQEDLSADADIFLAPWNPIYLRALALAIRERGEDEGEQFSDVMKAYEMALGNEIAYEQRHQHHGLGGGDWTVVGDY